MRYIQSLVGIVVGSLLLACSGSKKTADYQVIPLPQSIETQQGKDFVMNNNTKIRYPQSNESMRKNAEFLAQYILQMTGLDLTVEPGDAGENIILLKIDNQGENPEGYTLSIDKTNATISGTTEAGVFYGIQTLRKAIPAGQTKQIYFPPVEIKDYPRFPYRGAHLDVSRHFFPTDSIKKFIDMLALHNINRFHWHLTDDQGWRIEIKKHPRLTEIASKRPETVIGHNTGKYDGTPHEGFYSQQEAKEIVAYARDRHITVIPEIDLPGHMQAALTAYPELGCTGGPYEVWEMWGISDDVLCAGNEQTLLFIDDVLEEITEIFPSEYIHIGGDECPKVRWEKCPKCQAKIRALGLKDDKEHTAEQKLQSFIMAHAEKFLNERGRKIIGWDEILEGGLAPNATVMSWRGIDGGIAAARQKHQAIMTPTSFLYFDYYQSKDTEQEPIAIGGYVPVEKVYSFEPIPEVLTPEEQKYIIGVQANLWTEYIPTYAQVEYMELPRMAALAEVQWTMPDKKDYAHFLARLPQLIAIYDLEGYNYARHLLDVAAVFVPNPETGTLDIAFSTIDNAPIHYTLDGTEPSENSPLYSDTLKLSKDCQIKAVVIRPSGNSRIFSETITLNKASLKPIKMLQPINKQYGFKGAPTLVDGLRGDRNYKTGRWIAFYRNDMEAVIDLMEPTEISKAKITTCVEKGDWVFDAREFSVAVSEDGETFRPVASESYPVMKADDPNGLFEHELTFNPIKTRFVKIIVKPEHKLPEWHGGKGNPAFVFLDEIVLE